MVNPSEVREDPRFEARKSLCLKERSSGVSDEVRGFAKFQDRRSSGIADLYHPRALDRVALQFGRKFLGELPDSDGDDSIFSCREEVSVNQAPPRGG